MGRKNGRRRNPSANGAGAAAAAAPENPEVKPRGAFSSPAALVADADTEPRHPDTPVPPHLRAASRRPVAAAEPFTPAPTNTGDALRRRIERSSEAALAARVAGAAAAYEPEENDSEEMRFVRSEPSSPTPVVTSEAPAISPFNPALLSPASKIHYRNTANFVSIINPDDLTQIDAAFAAARLEMTDAQKEKMARRKLERLGLDLSSPASNRQAESAKAIRADEQNRLKSAIAREAVARAAEMAREQRKKAEARVADEAKATALAQLAVAESKVAAAIEAAETQLGELQPVKASAVDSDGSIPKSIILREQEIEQFGTVIKEKEAAAYAALETVAAANAAASKAHHKALTAVQSSITELQALAEKLETVTDDQALNVSEQLSTEASNLISTTEEKIEKSLEERATAIEELNKTIDHAKTASAALKAIYDNIIAARPEAGAAAAAAGAAADLDSTIANFMAEGDADEDEDEDDDKRATPPHDRPRANSFTSNGFGSPAQPANTRHDGIGQRERAPSAQMADGAIDPSVVAVINAFEALRKLAIDNKWEEKANRNQGDYFERVAIVKLLFRSLSSDDDTLQNGASLHAKKLKDLILEASNIDTDKFTIALYQMGAIQLKQALRSEKLGTTYNEIFLDDKAKATFTDDIKNAGRAFRLPYREGETRDRDSVRPIMIAQGSCRVGVPFFNARANFRSANQSFEGCLVNLAKALRASVIENTNSPALRR